MSEDLRWLMDEPFDEHDDYQEDDDQQTAFFFGHVYMMDDSEFDDLGPECHMCGKYIVGAQFIDGDKIHCGECHQIWNS